LSLSSFTILDKSGLEGGIGGDPHVLTIEGVHTLLPNEWKYVRLYEKDEIHVYAKCDMLDETVIANLHLCGKDNIIRNYKNIASRPTFSHATEIDIYKHDDLVFKIDMINGIVILKSNDIYVENKNNAKLYSLTYKKYYKKVNSKGYLIKLNNNNMMEIVIDNFWDDINYFKLFFFDSNKNGYSGEFFEHNESNDLTNKK